MRKTIYIFLFILCCFYLSMAATLEIKQIRQITLFQDENVIISSPRSIVVTEDEMIFIFDMKASDIKIFDMSGKIVKVFGRNGLGPDEFVKPIMSSYKKPYLLIGDYGRKTIFIYKRTGRDSLEFSSKFFYPDLGDQIHFLNENVLLFCGYKSTEEKKCYDIYEYDLKRKKYKYILETEYAYGFKTFKEFDDEAGKRLMYLGLDKYSNVTNENIYVVGACDITKIVRINRKTNGFTYFGHKTENYVQPYVTPEIISAYRERKHLVLYVLTQPMSMIRDIFVTKGGNVGVVYVGPFVKDKGLQVMLQLYSKTGVFLKELQLTYSNASSQYDSNFYLNRDKNLLYVLDAIDTKDYDQEYKIYEYQVNE